MRSGSIGDEGRTNRPVSQSDISVPCCRVASNPMRARKLLVIFFFLWLGLNAAFADWAVLDGRTTTGEPLGNGIGPGTLYMTVVPSGCNTYTQGWSGGWNYVSYNYFPNTSSAEWGIEGTNWGFWTCPPDYPPPGQISAVISGSGPGWYATGSGRSSPMARHGAKSSPIFIRARRRLKRKTLPKTSKWAATSACAASYTNGAIQRARDVRQSGTFRIARCALLLRSGRQWILS